MSCRVIKKEKSERLVSHWEHASKGACFFFNRFLFILLSIATLSLSFSVSPLFSFYFPFISQWEVKWVCSVHQCGLVWRVAAFLHCWFIMYEHGRSVDLRQNVPRCYLTSISPDTVQAWLYHKPEHVPEQKPYPAALMMSAHLQQWRQSCFSGKKTRWLFENNTQMGFEN